MYTLKKSSTTQQLGIDGKYRLKFLHAYARSTIHFVTHFTELCMVDHACRLLSDRKKRKIKK